VEALPFRERRIAPGEPVRVLTVGRLVEKKGIDLGIQAVATVRSRGVELRYDVVGEGPLREPLDELVRNLGLADVVRLHGARDGPYVRKRLAEAHLFLLPSRTAANGDQEGTPVSLMEAQACGLPILSTRHSGIPEVVAGGQSGLLVPEGEAEALAEGLLTLLARADDWPEMGRRGREHVAREYDLDDWTDHLLALYDTVVAGRRA
jgi:colanic acid/amylovoran biosynthesis glycosyltransferase